jgi:hypothetical protein
VLKPFPHDKASFLEPQSVVAMYRMGPAMDAAQQQPCQAKELEFSDSDIIFGLSAWALPWGGIFSFFLVSLVSIWCMKLHIFGHFGTFVRMVESHARFSGQFFWSIGPLTHILHELSKTVFKFQKFHVDGLLALIQQIWHIWPNLGQYISAHPVKYDGVGTADSLILCLVRAQCFCYNLAKPAAFRQLFGPKRTVLNVLRTKAQLSD